MFQDIKQMSAKLRETYDQLANLRNFFKVDFDQDKTVIVEKCSELSLALQKEYEETEDEKIIKIIRDFNGAIDDYELYDT